MRVILYTVYPFRAGTDRPISDEHVVRLEYETAPTMQGIEPFRITWETPGWKRDVARYIDVIEAVTALNGEIASMTRLHSKGTEQIEYAPLRAISHD